MSGDWVVARHRLALGIEPIDALLQSRLARAIQVEVEGADSRRAITRHETGRHALLGPERLGESVDLRLYDRRRGFVPRRLRVPLPEVEERKAELRTRRPVLFPGVAWDLGGGATALRGRVQLDQQPVRWAWLEARLPDSDEVVLRTRADDRGEYLLVLDAAAISLAELTPTFELDLRAYGPSSIEAPAKDEDDPLWDLPLEPLAAPGDPDPIAEGAPSLPTQLPADWTTLGERRVTLELGRTNSERADLLSF
ncbi:MAG: hypothetical protein R6X02_33910 [Enhygromyxa sp.]